MPSGSGFLGGYGVGLRSAYATPAELGAKPWALDFSVGSGWPAFSAGQRFDPTESLLQWATEDWDPGLCFWDLPFDAGLQEWLQDVNLAAPSVMATREFAHQHARWQAQALEDGGAGLCRPEAPGVPWIAAKDLAWRVDRASTRASRRAAWQAIQIELQDLVDLMEDDRARYLDEAWLQSDGIPMYFGHFLAIDSASKPWTFELMRCALAIGNLVYMHYKSYFRRVRPSTLCPGLVPPWGPPRHPAFPSGHSFLGHFIALLLLEIEPLANRYGVFGPADPHRGSRPDRSDYQARDYGEDMRSPLLWLAWRLAKNRERIGVHYRSDSAASRRLAGAVWQALFGDAPTIQLPTLARVLSHARAEWPPLTPVPAADEAAGKRPPTAYGAASGGLRKSGS